MHQAVGAPKLYLALDGMLLAQQQFVASYGDHQ
jgi:hypothetical protein